LKGREIKGKGGGGGGGETKKNLVHKKKHVDVMVEGRRKDEQS